jgi:hypothetical protein
VADADQNLGPFTADSSLQTGTIPYRYRDLTYRQGPNLGPFLTDREPSNGNTEGVGSHTEGMDSHTEGLDSHMQGVDSHTEGVDSQTEGVDSPTEGVDSHTERAWYLDRDPRPEAVGGDDESPAGALGQQHLCVTNRM